MGAAASWERRPIRVLTRIVERCKFRIRNWSQKSYLHILCSPAIRNQDKNVRYEFNLSEVSASAAIAKGSACVFHRHVDTKEDTDGAVGPRRMRNEPRSSGNDGDSKGPALAALWATVPVLRACLHSRLIKPAGQQRPKSCRVTTSASPPFSHDPNYQPLPSRSYKQWAYFSRYFTAVDDGDDGLMLLSSTQDRLEDLGTDTEEGQAIMLE